MNKQEIRADVDRRIAQGEKKSDVFAALQGQGVRDGVLANLIASHVDAALISTHARLIKGMVIIAWMQVVLGTLFCLSMALKSGAIFGLVLAAVVAGVSYLFVWGFQRHQAWAYNVTIMLSIVNLPKALTNVASEPASSVLSLILGVSWIAYAWFVRSKIFPDFVFLGPRKVRGTYQFSN